MSPNKVYGIARNDVMMSQEGEVQDMFASTSATAGPPTSSSSFSLPSSNHFLKREIDCKPQPFYSSVCKKLDFSDSTPEKLYEHSGFQTANSSSYFSSLVCSVSSGLTPIKTQVTCASGLFPVKQETMTTPDRTANSCRGCFMGINNSGGSGHVGGSGSHGLMTPVKLSSDLCMTDTALFSPSSAWTLGTAMDARVPQAGGLSDLEELAEMDDDHGLLCMENFDMETEFPDTLAQEKTPQRLPTPSKPKHDCKKRSCCKKKRHTGTKVCKHTCTHRPGPRCRKRLEGLYEKLTADGTKDTNSRHLSPDRYGDQAECCEFDGYLLYYQQIAPGLKKKLGQGHDADSLAAMVSDMWSRLPTDDRRTMVTLAALENQDSNSSSVGSNSLSKDLEELNVTPLQDNGQQLR